MNTKSLLTRVATPLLALGLLGGLGATLATSASASTLPGSVVITTQDQAKAIMDAGLPINHNVDIPAGARIELRWVHITGNLSVEGQLRLASSTIDRNVGVSGPDAGLSLFNDPGNHILGNLTVNGAGGFYDGRFFPNTSLGIYSNGQQVDGNLGFLNNTGSQINPSGSLTVNGNFTYSGNVTPYAGGLTVLGNSSIS